jgi:NADH-quinone oxidoreductase subunit C/D
MPEGHYKSNHPLTTPPVKERTMEDIETLITHFLGVTWGPVIHGEAMVPAEAAKEAMVITCHDGSTSSYVPG